MFSSIAERGGYYDEDGILRLPAPKFDNSYHRLDEQTIQRREAMIVAAAATSMTTEEVEAYAEMDPTGTYEVQSEAVKRTIDEDTTRVIAVSYARLHSDQRQTKLIERARLLASTIHGHSSSARLTAPLPPLALPDDTGVMKPVQQLDARLLGEEGITVLQESDAFHTILQVFTFIQQTEADGKPFTLMMLENCFKKCQMMPPRHLADFVEAKSVYGNRRALIARVSYSFHPVGMYYVCFIMRLTEETSSSDYIGKDPFICSTGWETIPRVIPIFFRCTCK